MFAKQILIDFLKLSLNTTVPEGWTSEKDQNGNTYYLNAKTNQSQWERPQSQIQEDHEEKRVRKQSRKKTSSKKHADRIEF